MPHTVTIAHTDYRARAECCCSWRSPWSTAGPPQPDVPPRPDYVDRVVRAAQFHVRNA